MQQIRNDNIDSIEKEYRQMIGYIIKTKSKLKKSSYKVPEGLKNPKVKDYLKMMRKITKFFNKTSKKKLDEFYILHYTNGERDIERLSITDIKEFIKKMIAKNLENVKKNPENCSNEINSFAALANNLLLLYIRDDDLMNQFRIAKMLAILQKYVDNAVMRCTFMLNITNSFFQCREYKGAFKISSHAEKLLKRQMKKEGPGRKLVDLCCNAVYFKGITCYLGDFIPDPLERFKESRGYFNECYTIVNKNFNNAEEELTKFLRHVENCSKKIAKLQAPRRHSLGKKARRRSRSKVKLTKKKVLRKRFKSRNQAYRISSSNFTNSSLSRANSAKLMRFMKRKKSQNGIYLDTNLAKLTNKVSLSSQSSPYQNNGMSLKGSQNFRKTTSDLQIPNKNQMSLSLQISDKRDRKVSVDEADVFNNGSSNERKNSNQKKSHFARNVTPQTHQPRGDQDAGASGKGKIPFREGLKLFINKEEQKKSNLEVIENSVDEAGMRLDASGRNIKNTPLPTTQKKFISNMKDSKPSDIGNISTENNSQNFRFTNFLNEEETINNKAKNDNYSINEINKCISEMNEDIEIIESHNQQSNELQKTRMLLLNLHEEVTSKNHTLNNIHLQNYSAVNQSVNLQRQVFEGQRHSQPILQSDPNEQPANQILQPFGGSAQAQDILPESVEEGQVEAQVMPDREVVSQNGFDVKIETPEPENNSEEKVDEVVEPGFADEQQNEQHEVKQQNFIQSDSDGSIALNGGTDEISIREGSLERMSRNESHHQNNYIIEQKRVSDEGALTDNLSCSLNGEQPAHIEGGKTPPPIIPFIGTSDEDKEVISLQKNNQLDDIVSSYPSIEQEEALSQDIGDQDNSITDSFIDLWKNGVPLKKWQMSLLHYRSHNHQRFIPDKKLVFLEHYQLDLKRMMRDFKIGLGDKRLTFTKHIMVYDVIYSIILQVYCVDGILKFKLDPTVDAEVNQSIDYQSYRFKREKISEDDFIKLISKIAVVDKLLPIDSIYTIGTFVELIEKFLMPSLIIQKDREAQIVSLEVWPFCIDILHDSDQQSDKKMASHWYYHMYENHIRLFTRIKEILSSYDCIDNENVPIDIVVHPMTFNKFFKAVDDENNNRIVEILEELRILDQDLVKDLDRFNEQVEALNQNIQFMMGHIKKYKLDKGDNIQSNVLDDESSSTSDRVRNEEVLNRFIVHVIQHVEDVYKKIQINDFSELYHLTHLSAKTWNNFRKLMLFMLYDDFIEKKIVVYIKIIEMEEDMIEESYVFEIEPFEFSYEQLDKIFCAKMETMEWEDRNIFFKFLIDSFNIKYLPNIVSDDEDDEDEEGIPQQNIKIGTVLPEDISFRRIYVKGNDGYVIPITLSMVAMNGSPLGVKVIKYCPLEYEEKPICMLVIHPHVWRKTPEVQVVNEKHCVQRSLVEKHFHILEFMELGGWDILLSNVTELAKKFALKENTSDHYFVDSFENFL